MRNYLEAIETLKSVCSQHPFVNNVYYNIYRALDEDNIDYAAIILTPNAIVSTVNTVQYGFNIMYVDRLMIREKNEIEVQSTGIDAIRQIVNVLDENFPSLSYDTRLNINVFTGQFADNVAGAVASIDFSLPSEVGECTWYKYCPPCVE